MSANGNELSRNPNVCASCSSLVDGMDDLNPDQVASTDLQSPGIEPQSQATDEHRFTPIRPLPSSVACDDFHTRADTQILGDAPYDHP